jgi:hypothetical protein
MQLPVSAMKADAQIVVKLPRAMKLELEAIAKARTGAQYSPGSVSTSAVVREAISEYLQRHEH